MEKKEFEKLIDRYLAGKANEAEKLLLHKFFENYQIEEIGQIWKLGEKEKLKIQSYRRIIDKINPVKTYSAKSKSVPVVYRWAAIIIIAIVAGFSIVLLNNENDESAAIITYQTQPGQKTQLSLPDGSSVNLNSASSIEYASDFAENRTINLRGEAFFAVKRDVKKPFIVNSGPVETKVLGTSFNVKAYDTTSIAVTVATGKVQVASAFDRKVISPGEQVHYQVNQNSLSVITIDSYQAYGWKDGYLNFENVSLADVVDELERWYGVEVVFENDKIKDCKLTLQIHRESLMQVLDIIQLAGDINYEIKQKIVYLNGKSCN